VNDDCVSNIYSLPPTTLEVSTSGWPSMGISSGMRSSAAGSPRAELFAGSLN
jgi:hypothetical protein